MGDLRLGVVTDGECSGCVCIDACLRGRQEREKKVLKKQLQMSRNTEFSVTVCTKRTTNMAKDTYLYNAW